MQKANSVTDGKEKLRVLNADIAKRHQYFTQQETQIKELVESGNTQLMGLHHDILVAKQQLREIKTDIRTGVQDKMLLNEDLATIREEIQSTVNNTFTNVSPVFGM